MPQTWLISESAGGLGRAIAETALHQGDQVAATDRNPQMLSELADRFGDRILTLTLDPTDETQCAKAVQAAVDRFETLDVLINNPGYAEMRPFEQTPADDFRALVEACFFGVVNLTRAALPVMRRQRSGRIIQISSVGGRNAYPSISSHNAAQWAVGGFTASVAREVSHLGIAMTTVEPGGMRTGLGKTVVTRDEVWPDYQESVGGFIDAMQNVWSKYSGDADSIAEDLMELAAAPALPPYIILGRDTLDIFPQAQTNP